jgi:hypothetical protein
MREAPLQRTRHPDSGHFHALILLFGNLNPTTVGFLLDRVTRVYPRLNKND